MSEQEITYQRHPASFRDPSGFILWRDGTLYRQVNYCYREQYEHLMRSGLYQRLTQENLLVPHEEVDLKLAYSSEAYRVLQPQQIPFISYPYEWCFSQLKDAALLTLQVQKIALEYGMILKDASAYNVQFRAGRPIWIDTLSFDIYEEGKPWIAYRQFCQHFLAPLSLMSKTDIRLHQLQRTYLDGIPLDLAVQLLPRSAFLRPGLFMHLYLHAKSQARLSARSAAKGIALRSVRKDALLMLIGSLHSAITSLNWKSAGTQWVDYYSDDSYNKDALLHKQEIVERYLDASKPENVWDLGANTGLYSALVSKRGIPVLSIDNDEGAVERNYLRLKARPDDNILPLCVDLMNPSPACGWDLEERQSLLERGPADMIFALALIHHLAIGNNVPLPRIAEMLHKLCRYLIIEFVPKTDKKIQTMLALRKDVFPNYSQEQFELEFKKFFVIQEITPVEGSSRVIYLMKKI